eukprot:gnl/TRDRNA2_/TRDRNA2_178030_c0_seq2.p2 gnl/TRDRNA2_/TRDRNA2_178030_c0~~gnl/TRDRNA2_/TRDRNA2_178030_c0_seq2.p2  ORF type:complete len:117 (-),score=4.10 gnl/TRDRNA2_/TRDRNA2_178030_c0_seq2:355-705(-)
MSSWHFEFRLGICSEQTPTVVLLLLAWPVLLRRLVSQGAPATPRSKVNRTRLLFDLVLPYASECFSLSLARCGINKDLVARGVAMEFGLSSGSDPHSFERQRLSVCAAGDLCGQIM